MNKDRSSRAPRKKLGEKSAASFTIADRIYTLMDQGQLFEVQGRDSEAEATYQHMTREFPEFGGSWHALGLLAHKYGKNQIAIDLIRRAIELDPGEILYRRNLTELSRREGQLQLALEMGISTCKLGPEDAEAHYNLGLVYTDLSDFQNAIEHYKKAVVINPKHGFAWNNLGSAYEQSGDKDQALNAYLKATEINPLHAEAQNNQGAIYSELGETDKAKSAFEAAIQGRSDFVEAHYNLSSMKKYTPDDLHLKMMEQVGSNMSQLPSSSRIRYGFALGKALDDIGQFGRAFAQYELANHLQFIETVIDEHRADQILDAIQTIFTREFFEKRKSWKGSDATPIFIVGMPRSGTSLLEQVLSTHQEVYGAGELGDFNEAVIKRTGAPDELFTSGIQALKNADIKKIAKDYEKGVWALSPESRYIVDKMPANFFYLGLIYLAFPKAKVIHAMRDPMDSCFSCYTKLFTKTMEFAYDQGTLGRYYVRYMKLMEHWRSVLPEGFILDMPYETLVADFENQARRILKFVGLPWDEKCLEFYKTKRLVKTASVLQVRKPIYGSSVGRWTHFAHFLKPLLNIVKDYRAEELNLAAQALLQEDTPEVIDYQKEREMFLRQGLFSGITPTQDLIDQSIALQGKGEHLNVLRLLETHQDQVKISGILLHLRGISEYRLNRFDDALASYEKAIELVPDFPIAYNSLGFLLQDIGYLKEAREAFQRSVDLLPEYSMGRLNLALAELKLGDFERGWESYESRWIGSAEASDPTFKKPQLALPQWNGEEETEGQSILVVTEQGFGDTFQFCRYIRLLSSKFKRVGFACSEPTRRLMGWALGEDVILMTQYPKDLSAWDWYCPLMSLPRAFKTRLESIPPLDPFFHVPKGPREFWKERLEMSAPGRFRVGIAWSGRKSHQYDKRRSIPFDTLYPVLQHPQITWVSLQKWSPDDVIPVIPDEFDWIDWTSELNDFAETAALASNLDLVISIDSAVVHLAASLGLPVWMLNRFDSEWRWLMNRSDSPWYSTLRIYSQPKFGDWESTIQQVSKELRQLDMPTVPRTIRPKPSAPVVTSTTGSTYFVPEGKSENEIFMMANQLNQEGRYAEAEQVLSILLKHNPNNPHAHHLMGVILFQRGQKRDAILSVKKALEQDPDQASYLANLTEMLRQIGDLDQAISAGERAVELEPMLTIAHSNLGIALYDSRQLERAESCHLKALALEPTAIQSINNLGSIERERKNRNAAADWYRRALEINPDFIEAMSNLGAVLVESDRAEEALPILEKGLKLAPESSELLNNLGLAHFKLERYEMARNLFERCLQIRPDYPEALTGYACVLNEYNAVEEAQALLERAIELAPDKLDAFTQLAAIYTEKGKTQAANDLYEAVLSKDPEYVDALNGLGNLALEMGKLDEAERYLEQSLVLDRDNFDARFHLTQIRKVRPDNENLHALEEGVKRLDQLPQNKKISLHYALGKCYDDTGRYDEAFQHFLKGARIKREKLNYDQNHDDLLTQSIIKTFNASKIKSLRGSGDDSTTPIFILGMPRSGTTLTEQIIASHPDVFGAGELPDLAEIVQQRAHQDGWGYPGVIVDLQPEQLKAWGRQYVERLREHSPTAKHITDKMPANYFFLGLIPLILPKSKIIHVRRNPVDTCVSCFTRLFNRHQEATYDLAELGRHYLNYHRLMTHWQKVLPKGSYIDVDYESLVEDINGEARRLIDFCGLEWNDLCLEFYKNKRSIRTASVTQVRQPIYKSSVERWRNYEKDLSPLLNELRRDKVLWSKVELSLDKGF